MNEEGATHSFPAIWNAAGGQYHSIDVAKFLVGRNANANLTIYDEHCSREQFAIRCCDGRYFLIPVSKRKSTYCNSVEVTDRTPLSHGDEIKAGRSCFIFLAHQDETIVENDTGPRSVTLWVEKLRSGDEVAAERLWERFYGRLIRLASSQLKGSSRRVMDEEDVVSQAFARLIRSLNIGRYPNIRDRGQFWGLLIRITENQAKDQVRFITRKKRGPDHRGDSIFSDSAIVQPASSEPTPEFALEIRENLGRLLLLLDGTEREIAVMKFQDFTNEEIAQKLNCSTKTIEYRLRSIRKKWQRLTD